LFLDRIDSFSTVFRQYLIYKSLKTRNDTQKILAGALAIVMVASLVFPAYAERPSQLATSVPAGTTELATIESHNPVVYSNGNGPILAGGFIDDRILAEDFVLVNPWIITDAHFAFGCFDLNDCPNIEPLLYFFFEDNNGLPGAVIDQGTATNVEVMQFGDPDDFIFEVWFDLQDDIPLDAGTTYWFGLKYTSNFGFIDPEPFMLQTDQAIGNFPAQSFDGTNWIELTDALDLWFALSSTRIVGGELLPIDTTALLLAGAQTNALWILSALAVIGSIAFGALYLTTKKN